TLLQVGPNGRQKLRKATLRHLEDGQGLNEELGSGLGDVLQLLGAPVGLEDVQQDGVVDAGKVEDAQLRSDRPAAELVGRPAAPFATVGEVLEKDGSVVPPDPLVGVAGHNAPGRSAAVIAGPAARGLPGAAAAGRPGPLRDRALKRRNVRHPRRIERPGGLRRYAIFYVFCRSRSAGPVLAATRSIRRRPHSRFLGRDPQFVEPHNSGYSVSPESEPKWAPSSGRSIVTPGTISAGRTVKRRDGNEPGPGRPGRRLARAPAPPGAGEACPADAG